MALFGKKKTAEPTAPQPNAEDEIQIADGDAADLDDNDNSGPALDFDAIAAELEDDNGQLAPNEPLGATNTQTATPFDDEAFAGADSSANTNADDELDFDTVFDDGSPATATEIDENPFGAAPIATNVTAPSIAPVSDTNTPPLTYTAPLLTSDAVATSGVPAARKSFPLPMLLGAIGLLAALGAVGYFVANSNSAPEETPVVATNPALQSPALGSGEAVVPGAMSDASVGAVNPGIAVDGVPIAPGPIVRTAPLSGPRPTVALTPTLLKQLKDLWKRGAAAKQRGDYASARAAWTKMLQLRPNHPGVQSAIDKLPTV